MSTKRCCTCEVTKAVGEFNRDSRAGDGLSHQCRACKKKHRERPDVHAQALRIGKAYRVNNRARHQQHNSKRRLMALTGATGRCSFGGCYTGVRARGLCGGHYQQWKRGSDLCALRSHRPNGLTDSQALAWLIAAGVVDVPVNITSDACWLWRGGQQGGGYGAVKSRGAGQGVTAHRFVWQVLVGALPVEDDGTPYHLHHECFNRLCCNPRHCEPMTRENHAAHHTNDNHPASEYALAV